MKRITLFFATIAILMIGLPTRAQDTTGWKQTAETQRQTYFTMLQQQLTLSEDQVAKIKAVHEATRAAESIVDADSLVAEDEAFLADLHQTERDNIAAILTPEQRQQLTAAQRQRKSAKMTPAAKEAM